MINITKKTKKLHPLAYTLISIICLIIIAFLTLFIGWVRGVRFDGFGLNTDAQVYFPVIIIDAGHGGEDGGASGDNGVFEKDLNLDISITLSDMLKANGVPVILTRTEDILLYDRTIDYHGRKKVLDLRTRLKISNDNPGAVFISIHMNAFPQKQYSGLQVYYPVKSESSKKLAMSIQNIVKNSLQPDNMRKSKAAGSNIYLLHENNNTAVLVECGFLSNDAECSNLCDPQYRQQLSLALFCSIMDYIGDEGIKNMNNP